MTPPPPDEPRSTPTLDEGSNAPTLVSGSDEPVPHPPDDARWERRGALGWGGMGRVTLAFDRVLGREALLRHKEAGALMKRLVQFRLTDTDRLLYKEEPIWVNGRRAGGITSGMYGHRIGASLGMGYVSSLEPITAEWIAAQKFEIEIGWERYQAQAQLAPFYDPKLERVKQ